MNNRICSINFEKIFSNIRLGWFYTKPVLFKLLCLYELKAEYGIDCLFRTNNKIIEYNPELVADKNLTSVKDALELELCRILLRHPYRKKPENTDEDEWYKASTITITQKSLTRYNLPEGKNIEFYYEELLKQKQDIQTESQGGNVKSNAENGKQLKESEADSDADAEVDAKLSETKTNSGEQLQNTEQKNPEEHDDNSEKKKANQNNKNGPTAYWGQNELEKTAIEDFVKDNLTSELWGNLPASFEELLKSSVEEFSYYKKLLKYFKSSTGNSDRTLTRMKPNRRSGFLQMGSKYKPQPSKVLIAIDTSESVRDEYLKRFYGALKSIYLQGIKKIDVIQFDVRVICEKPERFTKKAFYKIKGRGGTSYQCVFNYVKKHHLKYDGLIIFTDGFASRPKIDKSNNLKLLWMLTKKSGVRKWMNETGITGWL